MHPTFDCSQSQPPVKTSTCPQRQTFQIIHRSPRILDRARGSCSPVQGYWSTDRQGLTRAGSIDDDKGEDGAAIYSFILACKKAEAASSGHKGDQGDGDESECMNSFWRYRFNPSSQAI